MGRRKEVGLLLLVLLLVPVAILKTFLAAYLLLGLVTGDHASEVSGYSQGSGESTSR